MPKVTMFSSKQHREEALDMLAFAYQKGLSYEEMKEIFDVSYYTLTRHIKTLKDENMIYPRHEIKEEETE